MTSKKHRLIVYITAVCLLVVAVVAFAAFPVPTPVEPIRIMYQTNAGKVLFDHQTHAADIGYGISCFDCHHHPMDDEAANVACDVCHLAEPQADVIPESCLECHDETDAEGAEYPKRADSIHQQCWSCHDQYGKGPGGGPEDCSKCHII